MISNIKIIACERLEGFEFLKWYLPLSPTGKDLEKNTEKEGKETPSLELTFSQPGPSTQLTLIPNVWDNLTRVLPLPDPKAETFHYKIHTKYSKHSAAPFISLLYWGDG